MQKLSTLDWVAMILVLAGGINWGLIGLFNFNLVQVILGAISWLPSVVYVLVGLAAIYIAVIVNKLQKQQ
jgi:uncharacterized membrane protein YuzA (DUF378 family)